MPARRGAGFPLDEFGQESAEQIINRRGLSRSDGADRPLEEQTGRFLWVGGHVLPQRGGHHLWSIPEAPLVPFDIGVELRDNLVSEGEAGPALYHSAPERLTEMDPPPLAFRWGQRKGYVSPEAPLTVAKAAGSHMMPPDSLPVVSPSTVRLEPARGEMTKATAASRSVATQRAAGSNSHGDCRHCSRVDFALRDGVVPNHHAPLTGHRGPHPICPGSGESPASFADADGSDLLEA